MHFQFDTQKNQKTELPPMKLYLIDMDEVTEHELSQNISYPEFNYLLKVCPI